VPSKLQITTVSYRRCVRAGSAYYLINKKLVEHDGEPTVQEYLKAREIKFVPFAVEGTGALGPAVSPFIKQQHN